MQAESRHQRELPAVREESHHQRELPAVQEESHHHLRRAEQAASHRLPVHTQHHPGHLRPVHPYPDRPQPGHPCPGLLRAEQEELHRHPGPAVLHRRPVRGPSNRRWTPGLPAPRMHPTRHHRRFAVRGRTTTPPWTRQARRLGRWLRTLPPSPGLRRPDPLLRSLPAVPVPSNASACSPESGRPRHSVRARGSMRRESAESDRSRSLLVRTVSFVSFCHRHCRR